MSTESAIRASLNDCMNAARGDQPKDIYAAQQWEMAGAHVMILNALLHIYNKATEVPPEKYKDFVEYALQWYAVLDHHHEWEETIYYPEFNPKFDTSFIVAEHESFHNGVETLKGYLVSCLPAGTPWGYGQKSTTSDLQSFEPARFRQIIDGFAPALATHLAQEITYLEPEKIHASGLTEAEVKKIASVSEKHMKSMPPATFLVYTVIHTPKESSFPPIPGPVRNFLVPYIFYLPNRRLWQFAPKL